MHGKSGSFATQNLRFRNVKSQLSLFNSIFFTKPRVVFSICLERQKENRSLNKTLLFIIRFQPTPILQMSIYAKTMLS
ncbi:hypothetical protein CTM58_00785 [Prevotella intermedia]|uniref:Uncharacterized protein n=1 Tax=Prevotella intermedia TaxID=28131 RepID=A0A2M8TS49_PREIN|nr:hypothetical protein CBG55_03745 [Prevotella intermedia]PJI26759.1 hypothetical protein CTM58_00785 [Prevotella intermedia]